MPVDFWRRFLDEWDHERERILSLVPVDHPRTAVLEDRSARAWAEPASKTLIEATEDRIGYALPEDLRTFYEVSNGWRLIGMLDLAIASTRQLISLPREPRGYVLDLGDYLDSIAGDFIASNRRSRALLLTTVSRCGFCVADPTVTGHWRYA